MNPAKNEKPAGSAGFNNERANNSSYSNNLAQIYRRVNALCQKWNMTREEFERAASVWALIYRDFAPRDVQTTFTGRPSLYSEHAKTLALAFFLVYVEADDRLQALGEPDDVDASACWQIALALAGGTP